MLIVLGAMGFLHFYDPGKSCKNRKTLAKKSASGF
jgi:hypothetical protein